MSKVVWYPVSPVIIKNCHGAMHSRYVNAIIPDPEIEYRAYDPYGEISNLPKTPGGKTKKKRNGPVRPIIEEVPIDKIIELYASGPSLAEASNHFGVGVLRVRHLLKTQYPEQYEIFLQLKAKKGGRTKKK